MFKGRTDQFKSLLCISPLLIAIRVHQDLDQVPEHLAMKSSPE